MSDASPPVDTPDPSGDNVYTLHMGNGRQLPRWVWRLIAAVAVSVAAFQASMSVLGRLTGLISLIAIALFLSFAIEPAVNFLADRGWKRGLATAACFLAITVVTLVFVFVMAELVVSQVSDLIEKAPGYINDVATWAEDTFGVDVGTEELVEQLGDYQEDIATVAADVGGRVLSLTGSVVGLMFQGLTVLLFAFYMTSQGPQLRRNVCSLLRKDRQETVLLLWELAIQKTGGWIYSRLLLASCSAAATWLFLSILGVPSPLALAIWVGLVSQFIPAIGTYLAGALPVLIALLNDPVDALWVIGFIAIYQQLENYYIAPKITAQTMNLHPAVAFGAALAGAALAGPIGAIVALPCAGVIQAFVSTFLVRHDVVESHLTEFEEIKETQGDSAMRRSMWRLLRSGGKGPAADPGADADAGADPADGTDGGSGPARRAAPGQESLGAEEGEGPDSAQ